MNTEKFYRIAESLKLYRRADLSEFFEEISKSPIDQLYVDLLPDDAILRQVMSSNTTFVIGRKGTGKSTIFARAQAAFRERKDIISIYIDVKSIYEILNTKDIVQIKAFKNQINPEALQSHLIKKTFLRLIVSELINELNKVLNKMSFFGKIFNRKKFETLIDNLKNISSNIRKVKLDDEEIPILTEISQSNMHRTTAKQALTDESTIGAELASNKLAVAVTKDNIDFSEALEDDEIYQKYSDTIIRTFPYYEIINDIKKILEEIGLKKIFIFFDDYSELSWIEQRLFVDVILSPLNNASDERIKLKIAAYPGRVYYGKIDISKCDQVYLDFFRLYKPNDIQNAEDSAIDYTKRLLEKRFEGFGVDISDYFDPRNEMVEYYERIFQASFNVPRLIGFILSYVYVDKIAKKQRITLASISQASRKYYREKVADYFTRLNRYAIEPYSTKLDRLAQKLLLDKLVKEANKVKKEIISGKRGKYFEGITNPHLSHFYISSKMDCFLESLELNFLVTKYHEMQDKDGHHVSIYALFYGLCEEEKIKWGHPKGKRKDRSYFVQRCFNYNLILNEFLSVTQTIRCNYCGTSHSIEKRESIELFDWLCPNCKKGKCQIIKLDSEFNDELKTLNTELELEPVEIEILSVLHDENKDMKAKEISLNLDITYQLVGKRTEKMKAMSLVDKTKIGHTTNNRITQRAIDSYFDRGRT